MCKKPIGYVLNIIFFPFAFRVHTETQVSKVIEDQKETR